MANNLTRFDPFGDISTRFDPFRNIEDMLRDFRMLPGSLRSVDTPPDIRMDVTENDQSYTVKAEIPGVKKDDIKVAIDGNQVSISVESKKESSQQGDNMVRTERYFGQQYRSFVLAQEVDEDKATAAYHDGILELTLPKRPGTGGKALTIQ